MPQGSPRTEAGIAESFAEQLRIIAQAEGRDQRTRAIDDLAALVHRSGSLVPFLTRLTSEDIHGRRLALEIALRAPLPLDDTSVRLLIPLLGESRFPTPLRLNVGIQILRSLPHESPRVSELLQVILDGLAPGRALERLRFLQHHVPGHSVLERQSTEREELAALPCPRCGLRMQRADLIVHLWHEHRLLMDGTRAREPWKMVEDWLTDYAAAGQRELLDRASELALQLDPANGLTRVHRLLLAAGLTDGEARDNLKSQAEGGRGSLCPHCYALVPPAHESLPEPMNVSHGRIAGNGCVVEVSDRYLFTHLFSATSDAVIHDGLEPGRGLTYRGQTILFISPIVLLAFLFAVSLPPARLPPLVPVALVLLAALLIYLRIWIVSIEKGDPGQRAIDHAWRELSPRMHHPTFERADADFVARLSVSSIGKGEPALREQSLERLLKVTRQQVGAGKLASGDLAALRCLEMDDAFRLGQDPVPGLAADLAAGLSGELPLAYCEQLLEAWPDEARDIGQRARLRALVAEKAFDVGLLPADLLQLGRVSPTFGQVFGRASVAELNCLRYIHSHRDDRSWRKIGTASPVFDLARYPSLGRQYLGNRPDLLLFQPMSVGDRGRDASAPVLICVGGIHYRELAITSPTTPITISETSGRYRLRVGKQELTFDEDPSILANRLRAWARYLFQEVRPTAAAYPEESASDRLKPLLAQKAMHCPECGNAFLAMRGDVGIAADAS